MNAKQIQYLAALQCHGDLERAARSCGVSSAAMRMELMALEQEYEQALLTDQGDDARLTAAGLMLADWGHRLHMEKDQLQKEFADVRRKQLLGPLIERRSISPKRLKGPAPTPRGIEDMVVAALSAPDHGDIRPWRIITFSEADRPILAKLFEDEKRRRDPLTSAADLARAREHATRSPVLLAFVVSPQIRETVPVREQWLAAGAAIGNFMNAAHQLGYGAIMLSGERCHDQILCKVLGVQDSEYLAGFVSLGSFSTAPPPRRISDPTNFMSTWSPSSQLDIANVCRT